MRPPRTLEDLRAEVVRLVHDMFDGSARELFARLDRDGNGTLTRGEIAMKMNSVGCGLLPAEIDAILGDVDRDGNKELDLGEWLAFLGPEFAHEKELAEAERKARRKARRTARPPAAWPAGGAGGGGRSRAAARAPPAPRRQSLGSTARTA